MAPVSRRNREDRPCARSPSLHGYTVELTSHQGHGGRGIAPCAARKIINLGDVPPLLRLRQLEYHAASLVESAAGNPSFCRPIQIPGRIPDQTQRSGAEFATGKIIQLVDAPTAPPRTEFKHIPDRPPTLHVGEPSDVCSSVQIAGRIHNHTGWIRPVGSNTDEAVKGLLLPFTAGFRQFENRSAPVEAG